MKKGYYALFAVLLFFLNEITVYVTLYILGVPDLLFPYSLKLEYGLITNGGAFILLIVFTLVISAIAGVVLIKKKVGQVFLAIPISLIIGLIWGNLLDALIQHRDLSLLPFTYLHEFFNGYVDKWLFMCYGTGILLAVISACIALDRVWDNNSTVHGESRWATAIDLLVWKMFFKNPEGLLLAKYLGLNIYSNGFEHVLVLAPSGAGKSTAFAVPNILQWQGSSINNDMSLELYCKTATYLRKIKKSQVFLFSPTMIKTHCWNIFTPALKLSPEQRYGELQRISGFIIPSSINEDGKNIEWKNSARRLVAGIAAYLIHKTGDCTLGDIADIASKADFDTWLEQELKKDNLDKQFASNAGAYLGIAADETRAGIKFNVNAHLDLYLDPIVRAATSTSDFTIADIRNIHTDIFIGIPDKELIRLAPLVTMFWEDACGQLTTNIPNSNELSVLFNLDELGNLNRLNTLRRNITIFRKYRIRAALYFQYKDQSGDNYSDKEMQAFFTTKTKLIYTQENQRDAEFVSKQFGKRTVKYNTTSKQSDKWSHSTNEHVTEKLLITPDELKLIKKHEALISISGKHGIKAKKAFYFQDKYFSKIQKYEIDLAYDISIPVQNPVFPGESKLNFKHEVTNTPDVTIM